VKAVRRTLLQQSCLLVALALAALPGAARANHSVRDVVSSGPAGGNGSPDAFFKGASQDGKLAFFETSESLVSSDTDAATDVYERSGITTTLLSIGPNGGSGPLGANFARASGDGSRVIFTTKESLVSADTDSSIDVYQRSGTTTTLVSTGPSGGNGAYNALFDGSSQDGTRVFFHTSEKLVNGDTDSSPDVYEWAGGTTTLLSTGPDGGNAEIPAFFKGASQDGGHVFFETYESLVSTDTDATTDVYERSGGTTTRLSFGPSGGNGGLDEFFDAFFRGASDDGSRVFFETNEQLVSSDTDVQWDVYERSGGVTTLVSTGPNGGNGAFDSSFRGASVDGNRVFFQTKEPLVSADTDGGFQDVYERSAGATALVSTAPGDTGGASDASFVGASDDGSRVFFTTALSLLASDLDGGWRDIYERSGGATSLVSTGPDDPNGATNAFYGGASSDGSRVFFQTTDPMLNLDSDGGSQDVYERWSGSTTLISGGGNATFSTASFAGTSVDGTRLFFHTGESLAWNDTDSSQDVYVAKVDLGYPAPVGASPLRVSLVPAFKPCEVANADSRHGQPLGFLSCSNPEPASSTVTVGSNSIGFVRMVVCDSGSISSFCNPAGGGLPKPDVRFTGSIRDVKCASSLPAGQTACSAPGADYNPSAGAGPYTSAGNGTGGASPACFPTATSTTDCIAGADLTGVTVLPGASTSATGTPFEGSGLRITDRYNAGSLTESATLADLGFPIPFDCIPTADPAVGSSCGMNTTANALAPGIVVAGKQAVWQLGEIVIEDSGPDGVRGNSDDEPFEVQGYFSP